MDAVCVLTAYLDILVNAKEHPSNCKEKYIRIYQVKEITSLNKPDSLLTKPVLSRMDLLNYDARWIREGDYTLKDAEDEDMTKDQWQKWKHYLRSLEFAWRWQQVKNAIGETSKDINNKI